MSRFSIIIAFLVGAALTPAATRAQAGQSAEPDQAYLDFQVEKAVRVKIQTPPEYPELLKMAHVEGAVLVQFVVDETGAPEMSTFKVLRSSDTAFSESVRRAVSRSAFYPAEIKGRKVKQLVQQPYTFATNK